MKFYPDTRGRFSDIEELNEHMAHKWNLVVTNSDDEVYYLGDLSFGNAKDTKKLLYRLNGKIYYIRGNHDKGLHQWKDRFEWVKDLGEVNVNGQHIVLCHYAMRTWNRSHYGAWHLYGHSHGGLPEDPISKSFDIGVDTNDFYPYTFDDIKKKLDAKSGYLLHHGKDRNRS